MVMALFVKVVPWYESFLLHIFFIMDGENVFAIHVKVC